MAVSQLALYNNALYLIGQRRLTALTEDRKPRYVLDDIYDLNAIEHCLEIVKPVFATKTVKLSSPAANAVYGYSSVHTLPATYITDVAAYSDDQLDQPISRYVIDGNTLSCEYATVYLRYIDNDAVTTFTYWSPSFSHVVSAFLAREACTSIAPDKVDDIEKLLAERIKYAQELDAAKEPKKRSSATTVTLTNDWRHIYNDALFIMGLDEINANTDDSNRRSKLDRALDAGIVSEQLEMTGWLHAITTTESQYDPALEPSWGYSRVHAKPADMHRIDGVFYDSYLQRPLKAYHDEGDYLYMDEDYFYLQYVSSNWLVNPANWPTFFKRLVAAKMAVDAAPSLKKEGADLQNAINVYADRKSDALSIDAVESPPRILAEGKWVSSRYKGRYRGRP
jgi:hypothetical protein